MNFFKSFTTLVLFISCFQSQGQIIDIPDMYLEAALLIEGVDENNDGLIQQSEADSLRILNLDNVQFRSLEGLQNFRNLERLNIINNAFIDTIDFLEYPSLVSLNLSNLDSLSSISINGHTSLEDIFFGNLLSLTSIRFDDISTLNQLFIDNTYFETFEFGNVPALDMMVLKMGSNVRAVDLSSLTNLEFLQVNSFHDEKIDVNFGILPNLDAMIYRLETGYPLDFQNFPNLKSMTYVEGFLDLDTIIIENHENLESISIRTNTVKDIQLRNLSSLEFFNTAVSQEIESIELESIALEALNNLTEAEITNTPRLREASFKNISKLETLRLTGGSDVESVILEDMPNLDRLFINAAGMETLDLTSLTGLESLTLNTPSLEYLYIKNRTDEKLDCENCEDLIFICADESDTFEEIPDEVFIGSFCPFTSEGAAFEIEGRIDYDFGENNCASGTLPMPYVNLTLGNNGLNVGGVSSDAAGLYRTFLNDSSLSLSPSENNLNSLFLFSPDTIRVDTIRRTTTRNFCVQPITQTCEFELFVTSTSAPRPGEISDYRILVRNIGSLIPEGTVSLQFQDNLIDMENVTIDPDEITEGNLTWNLPMLLPFEEFEIDIAFELNRPTDDMPLNDGDTLRFDVVVDATNNNEQKTFANSLTEIIANSFDLNDKTCLQGAELELKNVDDFLFYRIRFENMDSADALNVVIEDTIDISVFDINSFQVVDASHELRTTIDGNAISFNFENINLGFQDDINDGFVVFKILPNPGLVVGDQLDNEASIYFDFNFPTNTNIARTTIVDDIILSVGGPRSVEKLNLFPSIADSYVSFDGLQEADEIQIYNLQGIQLYNFDVQSTNRIEVSNLEKGIYFVQIQKEGVRFTGRFIKL